MSFLRIAVRLIFGVDIEFGHTRLRPRVIRRRAPSVLEQFHLAQFRHCNAAPVSWGPLRFQSTLTFSAVLITQNSRLSTPIPAQPVRTQ